MKKPRPILIDAYVESGVLRIPQNLRRQMGRALKAWPDCAIEIELRPHEDTRSLRAHRYYFGVVLKMMAEESGHAVLDLHEWAKLEFNSKVIADPITGEEKRIAQTTTKLTVEAFSAYLEQVMAGGAGLGIVFPEPRRSEDWRTEEQAA